MINEIPNYNVQITNKLQACLPAGRVQGSGKECHFELRTAKQAECEKSYEEVQYPLDEISQSLSLRSRSFEMTLFFSLLAAMEGSGLTLFAPLSCSFSLLAQRKRTKRKGALPLGPSDCPVLLERVGRAKPRFAQTVCAPDRPCSAMLGCGTTGKTKNPALLWGVLDASPRGSERSLGGLQALRQLNTAVGDGCGKHDGPGSVVVPLEHGSQCGFRRIHIVDHLMAGIDGDRGSYAGALAVGLEGPGGGARAHDGRQAVDLDRDRPGRPAGRSLPGQYRDRVDGARRGAGDYRRRRFARPVQRLSESRRS